MTPHRACSLALLAALGAPAFAEGFTVVSANDPPRAEVRQTVDAHRAAKRDEKQRVEAVMGRRLTPAELAELRQQIRDQWVPRQPELIRSADSTPSQRIVPTPVPVPSTLRP